MLAIRRFTETAHNYQNYCLSPLDQFQQLGIFRKHFGQHDPWPILANCWSTDKHHMLRRNRSEPKPTLAITTPEPSDIRVQLFMQ